MNEGEGGRRLRRIVVGLHPSPHGRAALETAARLAAFLGAELRGVYVEEERILSLPALSFLTEVDAVSGRVRPLESANLERQVQAEAETVRRELARVAERLGVRWSFHVSRGEVHAVVADVAAAMDLVTLGVRARAPARGLGSTVRAMVAESGRAVMMIRRGMRLGTHVHAVDDGGEAGRRAVAVARALTDREDARLTIHVAATPGGEERAEAYRKELRDAGRSGAVVLAEPDRGVVASLAEPGCGLLVLPRTAVEGGTRVLEELLRHSACPVLVV